MDCSEGSPRGEGRALPGGEAQTRDLTPETPVPLAPGTLQWLAGNAQVLFSYFSGCMSYLRSCLPAQTTSTSSPPATQAQAVQENESPNDENQQPNEPLQESTFVKFKDFTIQFRVTGRTGGCEEDFLKNVKKHLLTHEIHLKKECYQEDSGHFLLVFCPVSSRVGTDMQNALEGLQGEPKAVLIMLHHKPQEYDRFLDTRLQAQHPALVRTVHARYTLEDGFYDCPLNKEATDAVAEVLKDHYKEEPKDPADPDPATESPDEMCTE